MAQDLVDAMCRQLGDERPSRTETERPPAAPADGDPKRHDGHDGFMHIGDRLRQRELTLQDEQLICECELIGRGSLEEAMRTDGTTNLNDLRRRLRLGMGPCQGGFCMYRATGIMHGVDRLDGPEASASLVSFLQERWKGVWPILYGDQLRQARLDDWIFQGLLDVEHLPETATVQVDAEPLPA
jgi:glycerol-3-phosphate dehydrogenase